MAVNSDKPERWKSDTALSVDYYNNWFMSFAPETYRHTRGRTASEVESGLRLTSYLTEVTPAALEGNPSILPMLRMATAPPIARDRLIGLAGVSGNLVKSMEDKRGIPPRMDKSQLAAELAAIGQLITRLADRDIFHWLATNQPPTEAEISRAATIVADRLCGTMADPIIRNAQEQRQLGMIRAWLERRGYTHARADETFPFALMRPGTFAFRLGIAARQPGRSKQVSIPIDAVVMPLRARPGDLPLLIEAESAGDFTNTNKRRKEEATKAVQLRRQYGDDVRFVLFLCGYFDSGYLGYEAAEGIDWVWEHRIDDLAEFGL